MVSRAVLYALAVLLLARVSFAAPAEPAPESAWIKPHMQALLAHALQRMAAEGTLHGDRVSVIDAEIMWEYSREDGLRPIRLLDPDENGVVHFSDGSAMLAPPESPFWAQQAESLGDADPFVSPLATLYAPVRSVVSKYGYRKAHAWIKVPGATGLSGIDGAEGHVEGAFNYFGLREDGVFDVEFGLASQFDAAKGRNDQGRWLTYHSVAGYPWDRDWPPGGFPAGSNVLLEVYVPDDNQVQYHIECSGYQPWTSVIYHVNGPRKSANNHQYFRKNTTLWVYGTAKSLDNSWTQVQLATPTAPLHWWTPTDTAIIPPEATAPYVGVRVTNAFYCESVSISVP